MVWGRVARFDFPFTGYGLEIADDGTWSVSLNKRVFAAGKTAPLGTAWHEVTMSFKGKTITVAMDGKPLAQIEDSARPNGLIGVGSGWNEACFDHLRVSGI